MHRFYTSFVFGTLFSLPLILFFSSYQTYLANKFSLFCYVISSCQNQSPHARGISSANKTHVNSSPWLNAGTERAVLMQIPQKMKTRERKMGIEGSKDANKKKGWEGLSSWKESDNERKLAIKSDSLSHCLYVTICYARV